LEDAKSLVASSSYSTASDAQEKAQLVQNLEELARRYDASNEEHKAKLQMEIARRVALEDMTAETSAALDRVRSERIAETTALREQCETSLQLLRTELAARGAGHGELIDQVRDSESIARQTETQLRETESQLRETETQLRETEINLQKAKEQAIGFFNKAADCEARSIRDLEGKIKSGWFF
jgi:hypothetical protein